MVDWSIAKFVGGAVATAAISSAVTRWFERRPRLVTYYGHRAAFRVNRPEGGTPVDVFTHSVIVRNNGGKAAKNVRLGHGVLPDFQIYPAVEHSVVEIPGGGREILIPTLVPREQVTVSYLYLPPVIYANVTTYVKSDEGFAQVLTVLLQRQYSKWIGAVAWFFLLLGLATAIYLLVALFERIAV